MGETFIHPTAAVDPKAVLGEGVMVWNWSTVREGARIGDNCRIGQAVYVDHDVEVGEGSKIQNGVSVYYGVHIGRNVLVGPNATFTNDRFPRARHDWTVERTVVEDEVGIGANATIVCGVRLGRGCLVGAGAVVTHDVPDHGLVIGNPARLVDFVDEDGRPTGRGPSRRRD